MQIWMLECPPQVMKVGGTSYLEEVAWFNINLVRISLHKLHLTKITKVYLLGMEVQLRIIGLIKWCRRRIPTLSLVHLRGISGFLSNMDLKLHKTYSNKYITRTLTQNKLCLWRCRMEIMIKIHNLIIVSKAHFTPFRRTKYYSKISKVVWM